MSEAVHTRRAFLRGVGLAAGGLAIAVHLPSCARVQRGAPGDFAPNAFLRVTPDDRVIFTLARVEMGQGVTTSETMLVAEELNLDPKEIEVEHAPNHEDYKNPEYLIQSTGGSNSTKTSYIPLRKAGAMVREALIGAAAANWAVARSEVTLEGKELRHLATKRTIKIGALAERAGDFLDEDAEPKPRAEWRIIGKSQPRLDAQAKVDGTAIFGADPEPPGTETAVLVHGPFGSELESFDAAAALKMPGIKAIFAVSKGVAVVADRYPRARKAAALVKTTWTASNFSSDGLFADYARTLDEEDGDSARSEGDVEDVFETATQQVKAEYRFPFLAHATMEPMNATVWVQADRCDVWAPTQATMSCANITSRVTGMSAKKIHVHQTLLGGGFGRKTYGDVVELAAEIAKERPNPVRLVYSREDDLQRGMYRPLSLHRIRGAVRGGEIAAWEHTMIAQSALFTPGMKPMLEEVVPRFLTGMALGAAKSFATDGSVVEGANTIPYAIENIEVAYHVGEAPIPTAVWRSVGHSFNAFVVETFFDELAALAGKDAFTYRRDLLARHPRHLAVLERAAKEAQWGKSMPAGHAQGLAVHESFGSFAAIVAEVSVENGKPRVHRVVAAIDVGVAINPDGLRAQVEGGVIFALSSALTKEAITFENGRVQQSNFHDFESLRMHESPVIETHIIESDEPPTGIGEVAVAPTPPAVANALARLTGKRYRELPLFFDS